MLRLYNYLSYNIFIIKYCCSLQLMFFIENENNRLVDENWTLIRILFLNFEKTAPHLFVIRSHVAWKKNNQYATQHKSIKYKKNISLPNDKFTRGPLFCNQNVRCSSWNIDVYIDVVDNCHKFSQVYFR